LSGAQIVPLRTRPWADVWRVDADDGRWWLKVNKAMTVYEPPLLAVLDRTGSALLAETLIHPDRPWSLIRDAGHSARDQHRGADQNTIVAFWCALMPAYAALAILSGLAVAELEQAWFESNAPIRSRLGPLLYTLCLLQFAELARTPFSSLNRAVLLPTTQDERAGQEVVRRIAAIDGEVFVPCHGYLAGMAGKRSYAHLQEIEDVLGSGNVDLATAIRAEIATAFEQRRFSAVIPCSLYMSDLDTLGLSRFYVMQEALFEPRDRRFAVGERRVRPESVYVPRERSTDPAR